MGVESIGDSWMAPNPTRELAEFVVTTTSDRSLPPVEARARDLLLDYCGVLIGGSVESAGSRAGRYACKDRSSEASVHLSGRATAPLAAMANGITAHALELDDVTNESSLHPGVVVWPAVMAAVERAGGTFGDLLAAGVAGYEVTVRVGEALNATSTYARGFHPTGVAGAIGAAAGAANVLGLDAERTQHALGLAGSMASGSLAYVQNGSDGKRLNAGWAAHAGFLASDLAAAGLTGPVDVLTGTYGLLAAYSDDPQPLALTAFDIEHPAMLDVAIKPYACCRYIHPVIDACRDLRADDRFALAAMNRLSVSILPGVRPLIAEPTDRKRRPRNRVDAQFSVYYGAALTLVHGAPGLAGFEAPYLQDETVQRIADRVDVSHDPDLDARYPERWGCRLDVEMSDGARWAVVVEDPRGDPRRPLSSAEVDEKFRSLAEPVDQRLAEAVLAWIREGDLRSPLPTFSGG
jgi:2-methylcitrate dehydratase PrpD